MRPTDKDIFRMNSQLEENKLMASGHVLDLISDALGFVRRVHRNLSIKSGFLSPAFFRL